MKHRSKSSSNMVERAGRRRGDRVGSQAQAQGEGSGDMSGRIQDTEIMLGNWAEGDGRGGRVVSNFRNDEKGEGANLSWL
jgi:hypothetical protein